MQFKIEKNVPMPEKNTARRPGRKAKYPFKEMKVGDSFSFGKYTPSAQRSLITCANSFVKRTKAKSEFTARKMNDGTLRVWRTK
jgi:hypothetical protein